MEVGNRIKELRLSKRFTQLELANILNVSDRTVSKWEQLKGNPDIDILPKLADSLGVSVDFLLTGKESEFRSALKGDLLGFISDRIKPTVLTHDEEIVLQGLEKEYEYQFLCDCFDIAHGQIISKNLPKEEFVSSLITRFKRVAFVRSRPLVTQKIDSLYYVYRKKAIPEYLERNSFYKTIYYYLSKANLLTDEDKAKYIDETLMPIIVNSTDNRDMKRNLKSLYREEPLFTPEVEPIMAVEEKSDLERKIDLMENTKSQEYLRCCQGGKKIAKADAKIIMTLRKDFGLSDAVLNVVLDYCLYKTNNVLSLPYIEKVAASVVRKGTMSARDTLEYFKEIEAYKKK